MPNLLLGTNNHGKLSEIKAVLASLPDGMSIQVKPILPGELGIHLDVPEDGKTYAENAERKARAYARSTGMIALADDSGLEVDALGGQPGIYSARYSNVPGARDADRRAYLLQQLHGRPRPWTAHFRCTVCIVVPVEQQVRRLPNNGVFFSEGICQGEIISEERGNNGFGYDPIFLLPELGLTMAQLTVEQKNELSHRGRALKAALPILVELFDM
jgi:XTP/dITP diphosphohydrolase